MVASAAVALGAAGVLALAVPGFSKQLKPLTSMFSGPTIEVIGFPVKTANLPVTVSERGALESSSNDDAYCLVEGQTTIIMILSEGSRVTKGELVCELDSAALSDQLVTQRITTSGAEAAFLNAKLSREVAEIAVNEYLEGIYKQDKETIQGEIALAKSDRKRAEDRLQWSNRMLEKKYVSPGQVLSDRLTLDRAIFAEEQAQTKLNVLEKYSKNRTKKELESEVEKSKADELAKQATWSLEKSKEEKLVRQIKNCKILAPNDGLVVYANDPGRNFGSTQPQIEEGATVRERQKIFSLPDITKMQVNVKVHESMIDRITPGLRGRIKVDAFADQNLTGTVVDVAPLPDVGSFFNSDVKVYTAHVKIDKGLPGLRPGMTAQVEILVKELENILSVPVPAVLAYGNKDHIAIRKSEGGYAFHDVKLGDSNDKYVEVKEGIKNGDVVALNPIALMNEEEKRDAFGSSSKDATKKDWGDMKSKAGAPDGKGEAGVAKGGAAGAEKGKVAGKGKGARGGGMGGMMPEFMKNMPQEERAKLRGATPEEREAILRKAGATDDDIKQMNEMRQRMQQGGGGGGGGGFGGPGGGAGGAGGRGPRGGGGFGGPEQ